MKSIALGKNNKINTKKGGRLAMKMKKIIVGLLAAVMVIMTGMQAFAYTVYDYNNYNDYNGYNTGYSNGYNTGYNSYSTNYGTGYSYGRYQYNVDSYVENGMRNNYTVTCRYYSGTATRYEAVKHYMAFYNGNGYRTSYGSYNNGYNYGYNGGYSYTNLQQFADYGNVVSNYSSEDLQIMQQAVQIGLLRGIEENGYVYLAPSSDLHRDEYAAFTNRAMQLMGINIYGNYQVSNFQDVPYWHWAYQDIIAVASKGIMSGYSAYTFGISDTFKSQDALLTYYRIFCEESGRFDTEAFRNVVNGVGYFWLETSGRNGSYFSLQDLGTLNVGDSYRIKVSTDLSGYTATAASWTSSNPSVATVDRYGQVTAISSGTATITCTYRGYSDSIYVTVTGNGSYDPVNPSENTLAFNESIITVQKGSTENLYNHLVTKFNDVTYTTNYTQYFTINGSTLYAIQTTGGVGYEVIARRSNGQSATIRVVVTDNNPTVPSNINPSVEWSTNNTVNTVYFTIRGIDSSCQVQLNANSNYRLLEPTTKGETWATYYVDGSTMEAEGGTTTLVVRVVRNGETIWESDPKSFYYGD